MNENEWACEMKKGCGTIKGLGWRIAFSALSLMLWFAFLISWLFFMADGYGILQNIGVFLGSVVLLGAVNIPIWISFAMSYDDRAEVQINEHRHEIAGGLIAMAWVVGAALWLFLYAGDFSLYQNAAVLMLSLVPVAAISMLLKR